MIAHLAEIAADFDVLYCDLWGCLHDGIAPYPEAVAALQDFRAGGGTVILLTNAPRPALGVQAQIEAMGVPGDAWDAIVTSGDASRAEVAAGRIGQRVEHVGPDRDLPFFEGLDVARVGRDEADGVVLTGLYDDETESPADYAEAVADWLARGLPVLCANPDIVVDRGTARVYCAGAIAEAFRQAGGTPLYAGKPHDPIYRLSAAEAERLRGPGPWRTLAVGDGIATDILGAAQQGIASVFVAGGLAAAALGGNGANPDPTALSRWLADQPAQPDYAIGRLR
jgi:HAD superfamily hydrolase (TIGR01459 family)